MTIISRGKADFLNLGDWNTVCFECGRKFKASTLRKHWKGYWVCPEHWEPREAQDFVKGVPDMQAPPWVQPYPANEFIYFCTPNATNDIPGLAVPGCAIPDFVSGGFDWALAIPGCSPVTIDYPFYVASTATLQICTNLTLNTRLEVDGKITLS